MLMDSAMIRQMNRSNQQGFVAIFSVLIIMGILTLLVIGFSNITRQAQRRALDDQLNTQAFYAAESGVNQVIARRSTLTNKESCTDMADVYDYEVGSDDLGVNISCLLIDTDPSSLEFDSVPVVGSNPVVAYVSSSNVGDTIANLRFSWDSVNQNDPISRVGGTVYNDANGTDAPGVFDGGLPRLRPSAEWGNAIGMVRVDLIPADDLSRGSMTDDGYSFFLYPGANSATDAPGNAIGEGVTTSVNPGAVGKGTVAGRKCSLTTGGYRCAANIHLTDPGTAYYMRLQSYYGVTKVRVEGANASGGRINFAGGQAVVDSTGRVADVSRRIQVRIPLFETPGYHESFSILSAASLCKRLVVIPGSTQAPTEDTGALCNPASL